MRLRTSPFFSKWTLWLASSTTKSSALGTCDAMNWEFAVDSVNKQPFAISQTAWTVLTQWTYPVLISNDHEGPGRDVA